MASRKQSFQDGSSLCHRQEENIIRGYLESLDCPRALSVWLCFKYDHAAYLTLDFQVDDYLDFHSFDAAYKATSFLSKYEGWKLNRDLRQQGIEKFLEAEVSCFHTNNLLRSDWRSLKRDAAHILDVARVKISYLLPEVNGELIEWIFNHSRFGPGVTTSVKGKWLTPSEKLRSAGVTPLLDRVLRSSLTEADFPSFPALHLRRPEEGNTIVTVPKNAKTDRTIAVEPGVNAFFQRGVGILLRRLLRKWSVDLNDQRINQRLAMEGSIDDSLATIDLSMASDSLTIEAVRLLLPRDWVILLETLRSPNYKLGDRWFRYEKHSSMGNGYTFELESLVFSAVVQAVMSVHGARGHWHVYGDDIVLPSVCASALRDTLEVLGFQVNREKSFSRSPFRESCGKHFYRGLDCTPFFYKRKMSSKQAITFANWIYPKNRKVWLTVYRSVPKSFALKGPFGGPGQYFEVNDFDMLGSVHRVWRRGFPYLQYRCMIFEPLTSDLLPDDVGHSLYVKNQRPKVSVIDCTSSYFLEPLIRTARKSGRWVCRTVLFPIRE